MTDSLSSYNIQQLPLEDRPRERLVRCGTEALSTAELLAVILGRGTKGVSVLQLAQELVTRFGDVKQLFEVTLEEFCQLKGMGLAKAIQLRAALALGKRAAREVSSDRVRIETPQQAYNLVREVFEQEKREFFVAILQDVKGFVINHQVVAIGTLSSSLVHPREVFYPAIRHKAASVILAHNHPSGDPTPSPEDISLTENLVEVGRIMGIPIHDHLVIGDRRFISLRQRGISFTCRSVEAGL